MKRDVIVSQLIKEGFSEKTLVRFSDKQLLDLHERIVTTTKAMASNPDIQKLADDPTKTVEVKETLKGKQKNIDKNHNGKIDAEDFAILNKEKKEGEVKEDVNEADMGLTLKGSKSSSSIPKKKSTPKKEETTEEVEVDESLHGIMIGATKEKLKKDLGRDPKDNEVEKELNKFVDSWKKDNESKEDKEHQFKKKKERDVEEGDYHNQRSEKALEKSKEDFPQLKNIKKCDDCGKVESKCKCKKEEVDELLRFYDDDGNPIKNKKGEQDVVSTKDKNFKKKTKSKKCSDCGKDDKDCKCDHSHLDENRTIKNWVKGLVENKEFHSFTSKNEIMELIQTKLNESDTMVQHGPKVKKGHNGIPEFMSYDAIVSAEPKTAPSKPAPSTKPGTRPTPTRREDPRKTPFQPGPGPNPKPKAKMAEEKKVK
jgi:5-bromo-4-chloroindolyl phosphate hydrolysis protein